MANSQPPVMCTGVRDIPASLVRRKLGQTQATSSLASYPLLPGDDQGPLIHTIFETDSEDLEVRANRQTIRKHAQEAVSFNLDKPPIYALVQGRLIDVDRVMFCRPFSGLDLPPCQQAICSRAHRNDCLQSVISLGYSTSEDDEAAPTDSIEPSPPDQEGGIPHRWRVVIMMAAAFVLCNMDKVPQHPAHPKPLYTL